MQFVKQNKTVLLTRRLKELCCVCLCLHPLSLYLFGFSVGEPHGDLRCIQHLVVFAAGYLIQTLLFLYSHPHSTGLLGYYVRSYGEYRLRGKLNPYLGRTYNVVRDIGQIHNSEEIKLMQDYTCIGVPKIVIVEDLVQGCCTLKEGRVERKAF